MNAHDMLELMRDYIGETSASHWTDLNLVRRLNLAQRQVAMKVAMTPGGWLVKKKTLSPSSGEVDLPNDFTKAIHVEENSTGRPLTWLHSPRYRRVGRKFGSDWDIGSYQIYLTRDKLVVNDDSYSNNINLWYQKRVPDLVVATSSNYAGGGSNYLTFPDDDNTVRRDDYYNSVELECVAGTGAGDVVSVSDYTASSRKADTDSGTFGADSEFGTFTMLPEEAEPLMIIMASVNAVAKPSSTLEDKIFQYLLAEKKQAQDLFDEWCESRIIHLGTEIGAIE